MSINDLVTPAGNLPPITADAGNGEWEVPAPDPFESLTTWESAWIDIGGEG
jgi:hypothetical protein